MTRIFLWIACSSSACLAIHYLTLWMGIFEYAIWAFITISLVFRLLILSEFLGQAYSVLSVAALLVTAGFFKTVWDIVDFHLTSIFLVLALLTVLRMVDYWLSCVWYRGTWFVPGRLRIVLAASLLLALFACLVTLGTLHSTMDGAWLTKLGRCLLLWMIYSLDMWAATGVLRLFTKQLCPSVRRH